VLPGGSFTYEPQGPFFCGTDSFAYTVSNSAGVEDYKYVEIIVQCENDKTKPEVICKENVVVVSQDDIPGAVKSFSDVCGEVTVISQTVFETDQRNVLRIAVEAEDEFGNTGSCVAMARVAGCYGFLKKRCRCGVDRGLLECVGTIGRKKCDLERVSRP